MASKGPSIHRVTLFKVPDPANQKKLVEAFQILAKEQSRVCLFAIVSFIGGLKYTDSILLAGWQAIHPSVRLPYGATSSH